MQQRAFQRARKAAYRAAAGRPFSAPADGRPRRIRVAVGDPQCPLDALLEVLARAGLLGDSGRLRSEVLLVSVGDHFDWGTPEQRAEAATDGLAILAWLASHPADQVLLCAGNHDLSRVGELYDHDDAGFASLQALADAMDPDDPHAEAAFRRRRPGLATSGLARRDLSSFREVQRHWVAHLLDRRRLRLAHALGPSLLVNHAGVTRDEASMIGLSPSLQANAGAWARTLNLALDAAWRLKGDGPLSIPGLYRPGSVTGGEGVGVVFHRASVRAENRSPPRRRYLPQRLPLGLSQVIGHVRDAKSRTLLELPTWPARDGVLRQLTVREGGDFTYAHGTRAAAGPDEAVVFQVDGSLRTAAPGTYELLDLDTLQAFRP